MIGKLINKLSNTLLFYVDKSGKSVFRNYKLLEGDGCFYDETYSIQTAGKALEYRMELDKKANLALILISFFVYLIFINLHFTIWSTLFCVLLWGGLIYGLRFFCNNLYTKFLLRTYGQFKITNFNPPITKEKAKAFAKNFRSKVALTLLIILLCFAPSLLMQKLVKVSLNAKKPHFKAAIAISQLHKVIYPKNAKIYDMSAYAKYLAQDYEGSLKDYEKIFEITGRKFSQKDLTRFANLLYLEKKLRGSQTAIDKFNEFATKKKMSVLDESQMLWMKSIFSISNGVSETVLQDYDDLLLSLKENDNKNKFYISSDKAYMMFLMRDFKNALEVYNYLISVAEQNEKDFGKDLPRLYIERGYTKRVLGDNLGADDDFLKSGVDMYQREEYIPTVTKQGFVADKF